MPVKDLTKRPLLFVNSDPSEGGTVPHRRAIYQHVQLKYAKWKRGEKIQRTRTPTILANQEGGSQLAKASQISTDVGAIRSCRHAHLTCVLDTSQARRAVSDRGASD